MTRAQITSVLATACALLLSACATVEYTRVKTEGSAGVAEEEAKGIRYLDTSPYLIVYSNPDGTLATRIEYLPDPNKKMAVHPKARGAKVDATFDFDKGVLVKSNVTGDATVVPKAILTAAKTLIPLVFDSPEKATAETPAFPSYSVPPPRIFKILVRGTTVHLIGGDPAERFEITLVPENSKDAKSAQAKPAGGGEGGDS